MGVDCWLKVPGVASLLLVDLKVAGRLLVEGSGVAGQLLVEGPGVSSS